MRTATEFEIPDGTPMDEPLEDDEEDELPAGEFEDEDEDEED